MLQLIAFWLALSPSFDWNSTSYHQTYSNTTPSTASQVPEIDPNSAMGALTLLGGGLVVLRGRRRTN